MKHLGKLSFVASLAFSLMISSQAVSLAQSKAAQAPANAQPKTNEKFFPVEQLKPGMKAIGYTVFEGGEPRKFELEILGVMRGTMNPGQDLVYSKLLGEEMNHVGVFAGMSGSPVYIDGKLLGAVAYGYQFAKDPIAGITPIQDMVEIFEQKMKDAKTPKNQPRPVTFSEIALNDDSPAFKTFVEDFSRKAAGASAVSTGAAGQVLQPIATPLSIAGVSPDVIAKFAPQFQAMGLQPIAGMAGAARIEEMKKADANTLKPGSTIVVPLIRGDMSISAAGTVTFRDGNKIYAFGHPFLSIGVSDFPMNEGQVVTVMPSQASSFKLAFPTATVGAMRGDRSTGIYGELGAAAKMIPIELNLKTSRGEAKNYQFESVIDRFLTPVLMQMMVMSSLGATERTIGDSTLQIRNRISIKGQPDVVLENRISTSMNAPLSAAMAISQPLNALFNSGFEDCQVTGIKLDIVSNDERNRGSLDRLWINQTEVKRGQTIEIQAFARKEDGTEFVERIPVTIPEDAPLGSLQVSVGDGAAMQRDEPRAGFTPKTTAQLVRELNKIRKADRLYVKLSRSAGGAVINNEELPNLPPSVLATLGSERTAGGYSLTRSATVYEKELAPAEFVVTGQRSFTVTVVNQ